VAVAGMTGSAQVAQVQEPVFKSRVDGVRIDVLVTDRGRPVEGLTPTDFEVRDQGVLQTVDLVALGDVPVSVVLALDLSASMRGPKLDTLRRASYDLLGALQPTDQAALLTFNTTPTLRVPLGSDLAGIRATLDEAQGEGDTALVDASLAAMLVGDSDIGRTLIVVFSDGVDTARRVNGVVYGVTPRGEQRRFLRDLATATGGRVVEVEADDGVGPAFLEILREFRRRYVLTYSPTGVTPGGWHPLEVRVTRSGARLQARRGYFSRAEQ
jgi:hypothetical protein